MNDDPLPEAPDASTGPSAGGLTRRRASGEAVPEPARAPSPFEPAPVADDSVEGSDADSDAEQPEPPEPEQPRRVLDRPVTAAAAATIVLVTAGLAVVTAIAARSIVRGWSLNPWEEASIVGAVTIVVVVAGWIVIALAVAASLRVVQFFVVPQQPPGLVRLNELIEQVRAEQDAAAAKRPREPLPQIIAALRAIASNER